MIDKKTESDIKALKSFMEFWTKFHSMYNDIMVKGLILKEDEDKFFGTKETIKGKYESVKSTLEFRYMPHTRMTDPVMDVLAVGSLRFISEKNLRKMNDDWRDSYVFLNNILERLKSKKRRLEQFSPVGVYFKRFFEKRHQDSQNEKNPEE